METTYFVLGMLSIIAAAFVAIIVWGMVKISKQQKAIQYLDRILDDSPRELNARFADMQRDMDNRLTWIHTRIDEYDAKLTRRIDQDTAQIYNEIAECKSYTDSRLDKALGTISAKQLIKG